MPRLVYESYNERFTASLGVRADANNYSSDMNNLLDQLSPRLSLSYRLSDPLYINANIGRYYELPPYTTLGFKDNEGNYVNRTNHLSYIRSDQAGLGLEYRPTSYLKFTTEDSINIMIVIRCPYSTVSHSHRKVQTMVSWE